MPEFLKREWGRVRVLRPGLEGHPPECATEVFIHLWCRQCQAVEYTEES